ncbi:hypothetical protein K3N28_06710 [Glycomyces sp. TRM65418]|uniref:hypothetical protein n=1 Tax=Glycomyces sp. TRM65418 TaxID=2867006 RepID=UPI001CE591D5|nr:hypothetical protein [Glycomyces sp. TRM65418]MCC3762761.1 hypothetical protein [Glycomyces sp. TRM65418]QZD56792.1 hypothetical protein K3N28_06660 [Glycomyces sp. TRM65418]
MSEPLHHAPATSGRTRSLTAIALSLLTAVGLPALAPTAAQAATTADHCVVNLTRDEVTCAATQSAALALDEAASAEAGVQSVTLITLYDRTNYDPAGGTRSFVGDGSHTCSAAYSPVEFSVDRLDAAGWNNRASSVRTYRSCDIRLWDSVSLSGASSTWIDALANLGTIGWNNRAGSYQIS